MTMIFPQEHIFPTRKDENWKYTSLKSWLEKPYVLSDSKGKIPALDTSFSYKIVFVNGCFKENLSFLPSGITVGTEGTPQPSHLDSLVLLNTRFSKATTVIRVPADTQIESTLQIVFLTASADSNPSMNYPQVRLDIGDHSQLTLLIQHESDDPEHVSFVSSWLNVHIGVGAQVECAVLQNQNLKSFHYEKAHFQLQAKAQVKVLEVAMGSQLSRSEIEFDIKGPEISAELLGIYVLSQNQQSDHYTSVKHLIGGSQTVQIYKGLLAGKSKGVFNGHVLIAPDAQKANSEQLNKNLLLSSEAEVNSKPELEIYADDVKATHGSTIGQIQKEEVFYLQTRGIKKEKAIQLVSEAFIMDVVQRLDNESLKKAIRTALQAKGAVK
jgi:Fe-S cluster assembly protein SufD